MNKANQSVHPHKIIDFRESGAQGRTVYEGEEYGLNKLEYFSGLAMQGMLANPNGATDVTPFGRQMISNPAAIARLAVNQAMLLLEELDRQSK